MARLPVDDLLGGRDPFCHRCGERLGPQSGRLLVDGEWWCPRDFWMNQFGVGLDTVEVQATRGRSTVVVPKALVAVRVEAG